MINQCSFLGHLRRPAALGKTKAGQPFSVSEFSISGMETLVTGFAYDDLAVLLTQINTDVELMVVGSLMRNKRTGELVIKIQKLSEVLTPSKAARTSLEQGGAA